MTKLQEVAFWLCVTICITTIAICITIYNLDETEKRTQIELAKIEAGCNVEN